MEMAGICTPTKLILYKCPFLENSLAVLTGIIFKMQPRDYVLTNLKLRYIECRREQL